MIDGTKAIEALHADGRTASVIPTGLKAEPDMKYAYYIAGVGAVGFNRDGKALSSFCRGKGWSIRNVEPTLRTSDEALRRMEALVERLAAFKLIQGDVTIVEAPGSKSFNLTAEARAIQALRTPIDPRLEPVVRSLVANGISEPGARLYARDVLKALDADGAK